MIRLVLDTNVVVAAVRSDRGASRVLLTAALEQRIRLLLSVPLMMEYEAVLMRAEHRTVSGLSVNDVGVLLDAIAAGAEPIRLAYLWRPTLPDAEDDMVLETAVNGGADGLVTLNRRHFGPVTARFGIATLSPAQGVTLMEKRG